MVKKSKTRTKNSGVQVSLTKRKLAAIMFVDMVGYTTLGQKNESLSIALVNEQRRLLRPIFKRQNGREVKTIGDAFLVEFGSALDATRCAYDIQRATREFNISLPEDRRINLRVGVHLGDVIESKKGDISGDAVNVASRIEPLAEQGGVCITRQVYDHVQNKFDLPLESTGFKSLKNVRVPIEVYKMIMPWENAGTVVTSVTTESPAFELNKLRVAVLPFSNMSPDPNDEYFADGLTEELISTLSEIEGLSVISRTTVMRYRKSPSLSVKEIARELDVPFVLEGSVRKSGDDLRINVQLIDSSQDIHMWSQKFNRKLHDIFLIQSEIAQETSFALRSQLLPTQEKTRIEKGLTQNVDAYTLFLKGRYFMLKPEGRQEAPWKAIEYFKKALEIDPRYAPALSAISECYTYLAGEQISETEGFEKAKQYARMALNENENLSEAHCSLGIVALQADYDFSTAEKELRRAVELNPSNSTARLWLGDTLALSNRFDEAVLQHGIAEKLDPLWAFLKWHTGWVLMFRKRYDEALRKFEESFELDPVQIYPLLFKGFIFAERGKFEEAITQGERAVELTGGLSYTLACLGYIYGVAGKTEEALRIIEQLRGDKTSRPFDIALIHLGLGEVEQAVELFERAFEERGATLLLYGRLAIFDKLKETNPRFANIMKKVGTY